MRGCQTIQSKHSLKALKALSRAMATSADTLSIIIDLLVKERPKTRDAAMALLSSKGCLPKKLLVVPTVKQVSLFASKAAEDYAVAKDVKIPAGFKGTAAKDKYSVKDLKALVEGAAKTKTANASPSALQFARDNGIDIDTATGSGVDGKILLKDVKGLKPAFTCLPLLAVAEVSDPGPSSVNEDKPKISPSAAKLMKRYDLDEDDVSVIVGTGANGTILAKDLTELIELIKQAEAEESSDSDDAAE